MEDIIRFISFHDLEDAVPVCTSAMTGMLYSSECCLLGSASTMPTMSISLGFFWMPLTKTLPPSPDPTTKVRTFFLGSWTMQLPRFPFMVETPRHSGVQDEQQAEHIRQENEAEADALEEKQRNDGRKAERHAHQKCRFPDFVHAGISDDLENRCSHGADAK